MGQPEHSAIINKVAKQILKPHGLERKGQSRIWLDDHGWFTTVVEFQPHFGAAGTFINVGVNFHWYLKEYFSFDIGYRESSLIVFETTEQFTPEVEKLAQLALDKVLILRQSLSDLTTAKRTILSHKFTSDELWGNYHKGVICGLTNDVDGLTQYFNSLLAFDHDTAWTKELKARTVELRETARDFGLFKQTIAKIIMDTRALKKLNELAIEIK